MEGEGHWAAIAELRTGHTRHERELGEVTANLKAMAHDVNQIAEEARKTRHDTRNAVTSSELRVTQHVDERVDVLADRIERMIITGRWVVGISVPVIFGLLGLLLGSR